MITLQSENLLIAPKMIVFALLYVCVCMCKRKVCYSFPLPSFPTPYFWRIGEFKMKF